MLGKHSSYEDLKQDLADIVNQIQQNGEHTFHEMVALKLDEQSKQTALAQMQLAGSDCNQYLASGLQDSRFIVDGTATEVYDTVTGKWLSIDQDMYGQEFRLHRTSQCDHEPGISCGSSCWFHWGGAAGVLRCRLRIS